MRKIILILLKAVPVVGAICCACNSLLSYFGYDLVWVGYVMQITFLVAWYAMAVYFRFCTFFRLLILYIIACEGVNTIDYIWTIPISDWDYFVLHCGMIGLFIVVFTYIHVRDTKKIKQRFKEGG